MSIPIWEKATLTIHEASEYSGIGINKLDRMTRDPKCSFVLWVGRKKLIKRKKFDDFLNNAFEI